MPTDFGRWPTNTAGPRQQKDLDAAIAALRCEATTFDEQTGVLGGEGQSFTKWIPFSVPRPEVAELDAKIRDDFDHTVTRDNVRTVIAAYKNALPAARESRPTVDNRITPDQAAAGKEAADRHAEQYRAKREAETALLNQVMKKAPTGATALIIAEYHEDASDPVTDYAASRITRTVAIGFRTSSRESFPALRGAAASYAETRHLANQAALDAWQHEQNHPRAGNSQLEHRENYSMGQGNYLSDHDTARSGTGWVIRSHTFPCEYVRLTEDAIPT